MSLFLFNMQVDILRNVWNSHIGHIVKENLYRKLNTAVKCSRGCVTHFHIWKKRIMIGIHMLKFISDVRVRKSSSFILLDRRNLAQLNEQSLSKLTLSKYFTYILHLRFFF